MFYNIPNFLCESYKYSKLISGLDRLIIFDIEENICALNF